MRQILCQTLRTLSTNILTEAKHINTLPTAKKFLGIVDLEFIRYPPKKFHNFFVERSSRLGDMYTLSRYIFSRKTVVISTPELLAELNRKEGEFPVRRIENTSFNEAKRSVGLKPGLLSNGVKWKHVRDPLAKRFLKPKFLSEYFSKLSLIAGNTVREIVESGNKDFDRTIQQLCVWTVNSSYYLLFHKERGRGNSTELTEFIKSVLTISRCSFNCKWYKIRKCREWNNLLNCFHTVMNYTKKQIGQSKPDNTEIPHTPLLEYLQKETEFDDTDILDSFITFLAGSMDATVISSLWLWYNLAKNRSVQDRIRKEICEVAGDNPVITAEHFNKLHYLKMCIKESMRLTPTSPTLSRIVPNSCSIGGVSIPKHTQVIADIYGMGMDKRYWRNPSEFIPERWENRREINPFSYTPFGIGPRMCIGRRLAEVEIQLITAMLCRDYRIHLIQEPDRISEVMVLPRGLNLSFEKRD